MVALLFAPFRAFKGYNNGVLLDGAEVVMHPHSHHAILRYLLMGLLITALVVLFPIAARSHQPPAEVASTLL